MNVNSCWWPISLFASTVIALIDHVNVVLNFGVNCFIYVIIISSKLFLMPHAIEMSQCSNIYYQDKS